MGADLALSVGRQQAGNSVAYTFRALDESIPCHSGANAMHSAECKNPGETFLASPSEFLPPLLHAPPMKPALTRKSLPVKLADLIEQGLRRGQWAQGLPGYRRLAEEFEVSWRTAIAALKLVDSRGLLKPAAKGQSRLPSPTATRSLLPQSGNLLVLWSAPHTSDLTLRDEIHALTAYWEKHRGRAHIITVDYARQPRGSGRPLKLRCRFTASVVSKAVSPAFPETVTRSSRKSKPPCDGSVLLGISAFSFLHRPGVTACATAFARP